MQAARENATNSQLVIITNKIDAAKGALEAAKVEYKAAHEAGDIDKLTDAQARISSAAAQIERFTGDKETFEAQAAARAEREEAEAARPPDRSVEAYIAAGKYAPAAAAFLRAHPDYLPPEYGGIAEKNDAMMAGHFAAKSQRVPINSEKYFEIIETHVNGSPVSAAATTTAAGEGAGGTARQAAPPPKRTPVPSAPPSRDPPLADGTPTGKQTVRLNGAQQEMALLSFPQKQGEDEPTWRKRAFGTYANEWAKAKKEGIIGRLTH